MLMVAEEREQLFSSDAYILWAPSRVQYRAEMLLRRKEEREARELERQREDEEKQNRLEVLRNQVDSFLHLALFNHIDFLCPLKSRTREDLDQGCPNYGPGAKCHP